MTLDNIIWLAGWLEGEGWFGLSKGSISLQVTSTDLDIIERAQVLLAARSIQHKKKQAPNHQQAYTLRVTGNKAEAVMRLIRPYMGERRGRKIDELLAWRAAGPQRKADASRKRWADPLFKQRTSLAIRAARPTGDPRWSDAVRRGWITRRRRP